MKSAIWKYTLPTVPGAFTLEMVPCGATILSVQMQNRVPCMWCRFEFEDYRPRMELRKFRMVKTGALIQETDACHLKYIGTLQINSSYVLIDSSYVLHLFEEVS